jgi:predicted outer membrane lipoprotein
MIWIRGLRVLCAFGVLPLVAVGPTEAQQSEIARYYASTKDICRTGVTPEIMAAYEKARQEMDRARASGTLGANNFAGIKMPPEMWLDCLQSPGDGKF